MRVVIAGGRGAPKKDSYDKELYVYGHRLSDVYQILEKAVRDSGFVPTTIISGGASGVDRLGERYAFNHHIPLKIFPADWNKFGKPAGIIRNGEMVADCDAGIVIWDGFSKGTGNFVRQMQDAGKPLHIVYLENKA